MRMLMNVKIPHQTFNAAVKDGSAGTKLAKILETIKPEAAYFTLDNGERTGFFVFDMKDSSQMPPLAEDLFMVLGADLQLTPVMNADEMRSGLGAAMAQK